jgi:hypothetical protein
MRRNSEWKEIPPFANDLKLDTPFLKIIKYQMESFIQWGYLLVQSSQSRDFSIPQSPSACCQRNTSTLVLEGFPYWIRDLVLPRMIPQLQFWRGFHLGYAI